MLLAVLVAACAYHHLHLLELPLLGWDAFPAIAASRITSAGDLAGLASTEFMGGFHPDADFFRPLTALTLGLDHALYGMSAAGYQLTNLALHTAAVLALALLGRAFTGWTWGPAIGAFLFAVHPAHAETLAFIARRGEVLMLLLGLLGLVAYERGRWIVATLLCVAAVMAKETGIVFAGLLLLRSPPPGITRRHPAVLLAELLIPYLIWRQVVLGDAGGYVGQAAGSYGVLRFLENFTVLHASGGTNHVGLVPLVVGAVVVAACAIAAGALATRRVRLERLGGPGGTILAAWAALVGFHAVLAVGFSPWYAYAPLAFACLAVGYAGERSVRLARAAVSRPQQAGAWVAVAALAVPGCAWIGLAREPQDRARLAIAGEYERRFLGRLERALLETPTPAIVHPATSAAILGPLEWQADERSVGMVGPYSLEAWVALTLQPADRTVTVYVPKPDDEPAPPAPREIRLMLGLPSVVPWAPRVEDLPEPVIEIYR